MDVFLAWFDPVCQQDYRIDVQVWLPALLACDLSDDCDESEGIAPQEGQVLAGWDLERVYGIIEHTDC